jgi:hypothetical protein
MVVIVESETEPPAAGYAIRVSPALLNNIPFRAV